MDLREDAAQPNTSVSRSQLVRTMRSNLSSISSLSLHWNSNRITRDGAVYLGPMLDRCGLLRLSLAYNRLEDEGAGHLAQALLQSNTRLRRYVVSPRRRRKSSSFTSFTLSSSLDIRSNNIHADGLCSIGDAVKFNSALTELFVWGNVNEERACLVRRGEG